MKSTSTKSKSDRKAIYIERYSKVLYRFNKIKSPFPSFKIISFSNFNFLMNKLALYNPWDAEIERPNKEVVKIANYTHEMRTEDYYSYRKQSGVKQHEIFEVSSNIIKK